jgi:ABC-type molybdate transport system substrate-binding protein
MSYRAIGFAAMHLAAAAAASSAPVHAETKTVHIAIATTFDLGKVAQDLSFGFEAYHFERSNRTIDYSSSVSAWTSPDALLEEIKDNNPYDVVLVPTYSPWPFLYKVPRKLIKTSFVFGTDVVVLYSITQDITSGLPKISRGKISIADPVSDPYGSATSEILEQLADVDRLYKSEQFTIFDYPGVVQASLESPNSKYAYGFIAQSQICSLSNTGKKIFPAGTYHHAILTTTVRSIHRSSCVP